MYNDQYARLGTKEGEKVPYHLAKQRDRAEKDVQQVWVVEDRDGNVPTREESMLRRWQDYFEKPMNEYDERERRVEEVETVKQEVGKISKDDVRKALKRTKKERQLVLMTYW